ncbi:MAG: hypothetical protein PGN21_12425 [Sphingomonas paucimobilis]
MSTVDHRLRELRELERRANERAAAGDLNGGGGDGTSGGMSDDWKKSVDERLKQQADDIRSLLRGIIAAGLILVGLIVGLYAYVGNKIDMVSSQITASRVEQANVRSDAKVQAEATNGRLLRIEDRLPK